MVDSASADGSIRPVSVADDGALSAVSRDGKPEAEAAAAGAGCNMASGAGGGSAAGADGANCALLRGLVAAMGAEREGIAEPATVASLSSIWRDCCCGADC